MLTPSHFRLQCLGVLLASLLLARGVAAVEEPLKWNDGLLKQAPEWYASSAARAAAESVLLYQSREGGWPKNHDLLKPPASAVALAEIQRRKGNTFDNGATTAPVRFLARIAHATRDEKYRTAALRGIDYFLAAQYANGGFPQFYPLRPSGYYSHITYNDNAMISALELLRDLAAGQSPFEFVDAGRRANASTAVARGVVCILRTQIEQAGKLTAWCAQYDEKTLEPAWARAYEPPSLSGSESVGIVRFLMSVPSPTPEIVAAADAAVTWFREVAIQGRRVEEFTGANGKKDRRLVADPGAPPLWARFYELGTNRPLYLDRDSVFRFDFAEIGPERRGGYSYHGTWPANLLAKDYPRWRVKNRLP